MIFKVLYLLLFISNIVLAQEDPCQVSNGGVTAGYMCVDNKMKQADEQLNLYYKKAIKEILVEQENRIEKENIESLFRQSQRDWLALRNSQCQFEGTWNTTSPWQGVQIEECKLNHTLKRIEFLKSISL